MGCEPVMVPVGHAFAKPILRKIGAVCGGELAGHYYFSEFHGCDSGVLAALRILGEIAKAIARKFGWTIMPDDEEAVNGLGLSTQIPARTRFISDGPTKTYETESGVIEFRHRCQRETRIEGLDAKMVIRGLKGLGRYYLTPEIVTQVAKRYSDEQWRAICEESSLASDWISKALWDEMRRRAK